MHVIKNPVRLQKHLFGKVDLLKEVVNTFVETNSRESLDEVIVSTNLDIYEDLRKRLDTEETITLHNYLKDCSEVCSCALLMPENVKASKKLVNLLSESVDILDQLTNSLTVPTARIVVRNRIKSAHVQVDRLNRTEYYDVWKERQKAS